MQLLQAYNEGLLLKAHNRRRRGIHHLRRPVQHLEVRAKRNRQGESEDELSAAGRHRRRDPVRVSVAAAQSEDSRQAMVSPACRPLVQVPEKDEPEESEVNRESIDPQPRRPPVQVPAKREEEGREGRAPMVNLVGSQEALRLRLLRAAKANRSGERKKERGLHRQGHNKSG